MIPGLNSRKAAQMMKKMGIQQQDIDATEVIIRTPEKEIVITNPAVAKVNMMGQETYQVSGEEHERSLSSDPEISDEDVKTVMAQTGADEEIARKAIEENGFDLAAAIMALSDQE
ncbi:MAG: nascent polypeptide-associated complex protein [archaeon]